MKYHWKQILLSSGQCVVANQEGFAICVAEPCNARYIANALNAMGLPDVPQDTKAQGSQQTSTGTSDLLMSDNLKSLVFVALGEASVCWEPRPSGVFDSSACEQVGNKLIAALKVLE